ncbi:uncharacterized protein B0I36DRAFT_345815 [Microdochium trichocladiopsis]|uniref:Sds3-like-domain-containing protein n=1 Tax=Microdochium trichocladiopsis TaxID=1682393 RepID=A0A9P8YBN0_9PEZI|nr:uncharacterized protein B0I36DRAFT_345815 [Microdochium trichocladiopsis]KAH7037741.1 hypothetical protein B0I36DRAFT_345815 [Microdochium trichocladiopsis]
MDEVPSAAASPAPSPAKGRGSGRGRGRGRGGYGRGTGRKTNTASTATHFSRGRGRGRGRGRIKTYTDSRVQAAYDRQRELRDLYSEVASAVKPALEELAEQTLKAIIEDPSCYREVAEFRVVQKELEARYHQAVRAADSQLSANLAILKSTHELNTIFTHGSYINSFERASEDFFDGALNRTSILAELHREAAPYNTAELRYNYVEEPDEVAKDQGPYVYFRNGIEIPNPSLLDDHKKAAAKAGPARKFRFGPKRKAEDQAEGAPDLKKPNIKGENGDESATPRVRHIGGLLSASSAFDAEQDSNAPSPPALYDGQSPSSDQKSDESKKDMPDLPNGASEPDARGVRTVTRRSHKANNRLIIPPLFEFDDDMIGYRDSTNDSTRKATRATRGRFLNTPNSGTWHIDQTIGGVNCLDYEDDALDQELVRKHNLHSKYGIFLPDSRNDSEPPEEHVDGTRPVVVITPDGSTLHASRTVRAMIMDQALEADAKKDKMSHLLEAFCVAEEVDPDSIVSDEMRERDRQLQERLASVPLDLESNTEEGVTTPMPTQEEEDFARESIAQLLQASHVAEAERPVQPPAQRSSRPYDAVRDIFAASEPSPPAQIARSTESEAYLLLGLSEPAAPVYAGEYPNELARPPISEAAMIDPRLLGSINPLLPAPSNAFLQTALNPTPSYAPIAPAPPSNQPSSSRNPFSSQNSAKGSPVLPPLRPVRRDKGAVAMEVPPPRPPSRPQEHGSPLGMIYGNSGGYYPPAPSRAYHHSYNIHEPPPLMPMHMPPQGHHLNGPVMMHSQPPTLAPYPGLSPLSSHAQLAPMPIQMMTGPPPGPPPPPIMIPSPPAGGHRHRTSLSSANGMASPVGGPQPDRSGKYRKIAAAPIPHNRYSQTPGGAELRLAHYDHKEAIKDYAANAPPPRSGPTTIRGWNVNNVAKGRGSRGSLRKEDSEKEESPK